MTASAPRHAVAVAPLTERRLGPITLRLLPAAHPSADLEMLVAIAGTVGLAGLLLLPMELLAPFTGGCGFRRVSGIPCMSCGLTRAVVALSHGDLAGALRWNPLFAGAGMLLLAWTPVSWVTWLGRLPRPRLGLAGRRPRLLAGALLVAAVVANWAFLVVDGR